MYFKNQKFLIAGISKSGESSARFLLARGAAVYLYDDVISDNIKTTVAELTALGAVAITAENYEDAIRICD
ncbi:MAG: hypothetical protein ACI4L9_05415, partial [Candidatus Coproplasma sp.]